MNQRELEQLEKKSIFTLRLNDDLKDKIISGYLNELNNVIKTNVKRKKLSVLVIESNF
jgi:hypothetical protein